MDSAEITTNDEKDHSESARTAPTDPIHHTDDFKEFIDIAEKESPSSKDAPPKPDIEAAVEADGAVAHPKLPAWFMDIEQRMAFRIKANDNLRTMLIVLLILHNSVLETVSSAPNPFELEQTSPQSLTALTIFVGVNRTVLVGLFFFVSGLASTFSMVIRSASPFHFLLKKTMKTGLALVGYQLSTLAVRRLYGLKTERAGNTEPYYALGKGTTAILHGPSFYIIALLSLDYIFAICRMLKKRIYKKRTIFFTTRTRYQAAKYILFISLELWIILRAWGLIYPSESVAEWLAVTNSAELHFPLLYIIAYIAGVNYSSYFKFLFAETPRRSILFIVITRVVITFGGLYALLRIYPDAMSRYLDPRRPNTHSLADPGHFAPDHASEAYGFWSTYVLLVLPGCIIVAFYSKRVLAMDWGIVSRTAYSQTYIHMIFVVGFAQRAGWIENLLWRCLYVGSGSIVCGWLVVLIPVMGYRGAVRCWKMMRGDGPIEGELKV